MDRGGGTLLDVKGAKIVGFGKAPQLGEPVHQPAFAVDLITAYLPVRLAQFFLEVVAGRVGRRASQVEGRVIAQQVQVPERALIEVHLAQLTGG